MDYKLRQKKAEQGIELLQSGVFPDVILDQIKDKRLRDDLSDKIFYPKDAPKANELSEEEKAERAKRLKVELAFINKMSSIDSFIRIPIVLFFIGLLMLLFVTFKNNGNLPFGIITIVEAIILFAFASNNNSITKNINLIAFVGLGLLILEFAIFQFPNPVLTDLDNNILDSRRGALLKIVNLISPFIYITSKVGIFAVFFYVKNNIKKFTEKKKNFEKNIHNSKP